MMGYGTHQPVMPRHDVEAFAQGCLPVLGGHPFFQIVDEGEMGIVQGPCLLHHPDAPVEVGGEAVLQVVGFYKGSFGKEGLMADQHALLEASPGKHFRGGEAAHADEVTFLVHQFRFAVQHVG